jgi:hypothetical protein
LEEYIETRYRMMINVIIKRLLQWICVGKGSMGRRATALILLTVACIMPPVAEAGNGRIIFSDPTLEVSGLSLCPATNGKCTMYARIISWEGEYDGKTALEKTSEANFRCCPGGNDGDNSGCQEQQEQRFHTTNFADAALNDDACKLHGSCKIKISQLASLDEVADYLEQWCNGGHIIREYDDGDDQCREMLWTKVSSELRGVKDDGTKEYYFWATLTRELPFYYIPGDLCMSGNYPTNVDVICDSTDDRVADCSGTYPYEPETTNIN